MLIVKSAYYVARRVLGKEVFCHDQRLNVCRIIWSAQVIPKVKIFAGRLVQDIIPTGAGLQRRGLHVDNRCCMCGCYGETVRHFLSVDSAVLYGKTPTQIFC